MDSLNLRAIITGIFFGAWPLLLHHSGLKGFSGMAMYIFGTFLIFLPFALAAKSIPNVHPLWLMLAAACLASAIGMALMTGIVNTATEQKLGSLIIIITVSQLVVPAVFHVMKNGQITARDAIGFAAAVITAVALAR